METLRLSSKSNPKATGGAIANNIRQYGETQLQVIGPRVVNQAVKAIAIAGGYMAPSGVDLYFMPAFNSVLVEGEERTAICFEVRPRYPLRRLITSLL